MKTKNLVILLTSIFSLLILGSCAKEITGRVDVGNIKTIKIYSNYRDKEDGRKHTFNTLINFENDTIVFDNYTIIEEDKILDLNQKQKEEIKKLFKEYGYLNQINAKNKRNSNTSVRTFDGEYKYIFIHYSTEFFIDFSLITGRNLITGKDLNPPVEFQLSFRNYSMILIDKTKNFANYVYGEFKSENNDLFNYVSNNQINYIGKTFTVGTIVLDLVLPFQSDIKTITVTQYSLEKKAEGDIELLNSGEGVIEFNIKPNKYYCIYFELNFHKVVNNYFEIMVSTIIS